VFSFLFPGEADAKHSQEVFFKETDHELHVYWIEGRQPGKTLLLIGGIQGNEPGGFLSADMELARGNLMVVPRANFYSMVLNRRQVSEDMNRKFAPMQACRLFWKA
jgi:predicted deacylase